jgi:F-type H+-transporting ATPase subunit delta
MSSARIAGRYAKSLIELAQEEGKLERIFEDIQHFKSASELRDLALLLKSPIVGPEKKRSIFKALFQDIYDPMSFSFLEIILRKGREMYLPEIADEFVEQYKVINQISTVRLITAAELTPTQLEALKNKIKQSGLILDNIELITKVDPNIIGGFVIEIGDKLYDASVIHKLEEMRKAFAS